MRKQSFAAGAARFAALFVLCALAAVGQTAQVVGRVSDATGAVIPGVNIRITNVATNVARSTQTNADGYYAIPLLPPGNYSIAVEQKGFKAVTRSGITLEVDQRAEINFNLEVGSLTENIVVSADALQLNTVEASQGQVIDNRRIVDMPLNGREYNQLALLSAGTVQPASGSRYGGFSSGGMKITQNNFMIDGIDNNPNELAGAQRRSEMVQPSIDAIQEFKVQTNAYAAEYGRSMGSVVNVSLKSGTNSLHGTAFEFLRNEKLDAKNFFDAPDKPKPPFKRNQFGLSLGGPVVLPRIFDGRSKVFFFGDFERGIVRESSTTTSTIPTARMRNGDFGELLAANKRIIDPLTRQPFPDNLIPASRIDPVAKTLAGLYPATQNNNLAANYLVNSPVKTDTMRWDFKTDVNLGSKDTMNWRLSKMDTENPAVLPLPAPAYGGGPYDWVTEGYNTGATWNHIWSPNLIMSIRGGWNFSLFKRDNPAQTNGELFNQKYGIKGGNDTIPGGFSQMNITGYRALGIGPNNPVDRDSQNRQLSGDATWIKGKHTIKFGANQLWSQNNIYNIRLEIGTYTFNNRFTTDGMADFLLGWGSGYSWESRLQVDLRSSNTGLFVQDDWKVTPRLTLNLGLRYELVLPFIDKYDRIGIFDNYTDPNNPRLIYGGTEGKDRYNRAMFATDKNNFMPRVGFAYKVGAKNVIRGGYGIFYNYLEPLGDGEYLIGNPPNAYGVSLASSATTPAIILKDGPPPGSLDFLKATGRTFIAYERRADIGYGQQWNLNIQREVAQDWLVELAYSGSKGTHLLARYEDNYSPPGPGNLNDKRRYKSVELPGTGIVTSPLGPIYGYHNNANSIYHAFIAKVEKRFSQGFTIISSYGWSKTIGDTCGNAAAGNTAGCGFQDTRNMRAERSADNQDIPHRFVASGVFDLPFGKGKKWCSNMHPVLNAFFGNWSTGSIVTWASGEPFSITVPGNPANIGDRLIVNRPNLAGNPYGIERSLQRDFDTTAFVANAQYTLGNLGRNTMRNRPDFNWDFSALKDFQLAEKLRMQFRFEAFHASNTPRFNQPGQSLGTAAFGKITGAATPRNLQLGLKLVW
ncbi:MAG: TonB-dependent receptor [Bryobacteraceae bacterium]|nr:TonB-dependent receptor [Bryobacteraceae bacterium]